MPNTYTVTLNDGTNSVAGVPASSHEEAARNVLNETSIDWSKLSDAVTLTITVTQP
jgi:hypothetical protein